MSTRLPDCIVQAGRHLTIAMFIQGLVKIRRAFDFQDLRANS